MALVYESDYLFNKNIKTLNQNGKNCWRYIEFKVKQKSFLDITKTSLGVTQDYVSALYLPTSQDSKYYIDVEILKVLDHIKNGNYDTRSLYEYSRGSNGTKKTFYPAESAIINLIAQIANDYNIHVSIYSSSIYTKSNFGKIGGVQFTLRIFFKDIILTNRKLCTFFDSLLIKYGFAKDYDKFGIVDHNHTSKEFRRARTLIKGKERYEQDILVDKNNIVIQAGDIIIYPRWGTVHFGKVKRNTKVSVYIEDATYYIRANTCMVIKSANQEKMKEVPWENIHCEIVNAYKDYF